ncbi:glycosyltransferase [Thioalkalivibrio sp. ALJ15]|uniref:glycosyltransferase n=1 Tax=Thioalkalivibrio sp. ALJ15 TaxID=748652 RepID=UPI0004905A3A|nr:glycosyltransferase [Thioalkalivibrio sp. ALJ15]
MVIFAPFKAWGGIERKMLILCREFLQLGILPRLVLTRGGEVPYPEELPSAVEVVDLRSRGKFDSLFKLRRLLRQDPPAAVLTAKDHSAKVAVLGRMLGWVPSPVFVKVTNTPSQTLRRRFKRRSARWLYRRADRIIAISEGVRDDLIEHFDVDPDRIEVIYNPTVTPDIPERVKAPVGHPWFAGDGPPVIVGAGRLTPQKDFATLLDAFARVRERRSVRLVILGEGPLREALLGQARRLGVAEAVDLPGYVPDPLPYFARAGVFCLSSRYEGLGNVLIEALAAGAPAVATDCPSGPAEILQHGRIGPLVPVGDAGALAGALESTLADPPGEERIREGLDRFRSDRVALRYAQVMGLVKAE